MITDISLPGGARCYLMSGNCRGLFTCHFPPFLLTKWHFKG
jgi:hypothetical protein